jgi:polyisoprenoid-binding protein YceI
MLRSFLAALLAAAIGTAASAQTVSKDPTQAPNGSYRLDTMHSQVLFSIAHLGLTDYYGRFDKLTGTLNFDGNDPEKSATSIAIDTTSVDTPSNRLNDTLKGTDVFSSAQFPTATFKATSIVRTGSDTGRITGDLTIKGVTKSVVLDAVFAGGGQDPLNGAYALGFHATGTIKRSDFGLTGMVWAPFVGDDIHLVIEALFQQVKE